MKFLVVLSVFSLVLLGCKKEGCIDPLAFGYSADANLDDGSCRYRTMAIIDRVSIFTSIDPTISSVVYRGDTTLVTFESEVTSNGDGLFSATVTSNIYTLDNHLTVGVLELADSITILSNGEYLKTAQISNQYSAPVWLDGIHIAKWLD